MGFWQFLLLVAAAVAVGLTAGLLFGFACAVMPGLSGADDRTFVAAFQGIDRAIVNPLFMAAFIGAVVLPLGAVVLHLGGDQRSVLPWTVAALAFSLATVAITRAVHLPLNAQIKAAGDPDRIADLAAVRAGFEARWVRWNVVRTATSTAALACLAVALFYSGQS